LPHLERLDAQRGAGAVPVEVPVEAVERPDIAAAGEGAGAGHVSRLRTYGGVLILIERVPTEAGRVQHLEPDSRGRGRRIQRRREHRGGEPPGTAHGFPLLLLGDVWTCCGWLRLHGLKVFSSSMLVGTLSSPETTFWRSASTLASTSALFGMSRRTSAIPTPPSLRPMELSPPLNEPPTTSRSVS